MEISINEQTKDSLLNNNQEFRELVQKHQVYEDRLNELGNLHYPNDQEQLEEVTLKKKKLKIKDEIYAMLEVHSGSH